MHIQMIIQFLDCYNNRSLLCFHTLFFLFYVSYLPCIFGTCVVLILFIRLLFFYHLNLPISEDTEAIIQMIQPVIDHIDEGGTCEPTRWDEA